MTPQTPTPFEIVLKQSYSFKSISHVSSYYIYNSKKTLQTYGVLGFWGLHNL